MQLNVDMKYFLFRFQVGPKRITVVHVEKHLCTAVMYNMTALRLYVHLGVAEYGGYATV